MARWDHFLLTPIILLALLGNCFAWNTQIIPSWAKSSISPNSVKLKDVQVLTLTAGEMTTGGRTKPVPQLNCVGGSAGCFWMITPRTIQCYNRGEDDYGVIQWECNGELDSAYRFGGMNVDCEGYNYPNDPYILVGSCSLNYTIEYISPTHQLEQYVSIVLVIIFIVFLAYMLCYGSGARSGASSTGSVVYYRSSSCGTRPCSSGTRIASGFAGTTRR